MYDHTGVVLLASALVAGLAFGTIKIAARIVVPLLAPILFVGRKDTFPAFSPLDALDIVLLVILIGSASVNLAPAVPAGVFASLVITGLTIGVSVVLITIWPRRPLR